VFCKSPERCEPCPVGVRLIYVKNDARNGIDVTAAVVAVGWVANTAGLNLPAAGVQTNQRGYVPVHPQLRTTAPHIFAAGDVTGNRLPSSWPSSAVEKPSATG
jgi:pyruvate/2-oxoglutarate dehydrogenase complex dihydrolipoamide dehydrogenase (E3) component